MAMDPDRLGNALADALLSLSGQSPTGPDETAFRDLTKTLAQEIIKEIDDHLEAIGTANITSGSSAGTHPVEIPEGGAD